MDTTFLLILAVPLLPLLSAGLIGALGRRRLGGQSHWPAILAVGGSAAAAATLLHRFRPHALAGAERAWRDTFYTWFSADPFRGLVGYLYDPLTAVMLVTVTLVSLLVVVYSRGYMKGDRGYARFFAFMALFVFSMCTLVLAGNFLLLYLGWELVGLCSYLLIGFYYERPSAAAAAKKAFIVTRVGDLGFALGVFLIWQTFGSLDYGQVLDPARIAAIEPARLTAIALLLLAGAVGKSAQLPLFVWLPDAMEGPSPVSALIHAATMVTAGVYLVARTMAIFAAAPAALTVVAVVGAATALVAATIALVNTDIKRILAYSTISQLGYMFLALGAGAGGAAIFHLFTHAFFKAGLFLGAGIVMHATAGVLDLRRMGGLLRLLPIPGLAFLACGLALAGFPGTAGFFSKDQIIAACFAPDSAGTSLGRLGPALGVAALLTAGLTAFYTARLFMRVFAGPPLLPGADVAQPPPAVSPSPSQGEGRGEGKPVTESQSSRPANVPHAPSSPSLGGRGGHWGPASPAPAVRLHRPDGWMVIVCVLLGATSLVNGVFGGGIGQLLERMPTLAGPVGHPDWPVAVGGLIAVAAIAAAVLLYGPFRAWATDSGIDRTVGYKLLWHKYYVDEFYDLLVVRPLRFVARLCIALDDRGIDNALLGITWVPRGAGRGLQLVQRGSLGVYALAVAAGAVLLIGALWLLG